MAPWNLVSHPYSCIWQQAITWNSPGAWVVAPSHYLRQCWLIINVVLWQLLAISHEVIKMPNARGDSRCKITSTCLRSQWVKRKIWHEVWGCEQKHFFNSSPPGQNGRHFAVDIFRCIFPNEKFCILIKMSLKYVPKGPINNNPALV